MKKNRINLLCGAIILLLFLPLPAQAADARRPPRDLGERPARGDRAE